MATVTQPQLQRNQNAASMRNLRQLASFIIAVLEISAWVMFGGDNYFMVVMFGLMALVFVFARPHWMRMHEIASAEGNTQRMNQFKTKMNVSIAVTMVSIGIVLFGQFAQLNEYAKIQSQPVTDAQLIMDSAVNSLEQARQSDNFSPAEIQTGLARINALKNERKAVINRAKQQNAAIRISVTRELQQFWNSEHSTGLRHSQIMTEGCSAKKSPYGGGKMKTAAREACAQLRSIQSKMPNIAVNPEVVKIDSELSKLSSLVGYDVAVKYAENVVTNARKNYNEILKTSEATDHHLSLFNMVSKFGINSEIAMLVFMLPVIYLLITFVMDSTIYESRIQETVVRSKKNEGEGEGEGDLPVDENSSLVGKVFSSLVSKMQKPNSNEPAVAQDDKIPLFSLDDSSGLGYIGFTNPNQPEETGNSNKSKADNSSPLLKTLQKLMDIDPGTNKLFSQNAAAKALGVHKSTISRHVVQAKKLDFISADGVINKVFINEVSVLVFAEGMGLQQAIQNTKERR